jgi:hypothetical protein
MEMNLTLRNNQWDSMKLWPVIRDVVLFCGGLVGVAHETAIAPQAEPTLLLLFGAMMGLPAFLRADERRNGQ